MAVRGVALGACAASFLLAGLTGPAVAGNTSAAVAKISTIPGTSCPAFGADNFWHAPVTRLPVAKQSTTWMSHMSPNKKLHPDFGPSWGAQPVPYGIPITVVNKAPKVSLTFGYADESDKVPYPLGVWSKIEGGTNADGDRHTITVDASTCMLYETWDTHKTSRGWYAGSGAVWNLKSNRLRPAGWTSADAAGLPILPGLLRYDEVVAGRVDHAIRFTTPVTSKAYVWPARHQAGSTTNPAYPPMGARFRLKANYSLAGYSPAAKTVLVAMKTYGMVLADNGSSWFFQGTSDTRWTDSFVSELKKVPASAFDAVDTSKLRISNNSAAAKPQ